MVHADAASDVGGGASADEPPERESVAAQLQRIEKSRDFDVPERARKFLHYVVEETLAGRADRIKAYSIALEVFGRDASFDAQSDPVVRIEAGRVRRALERYYLTAGQHDDIVITIPKGGYVPVFARRELDKEPSPPEVAPAVAPPAPSWPALPRWAPFGLPALAALVAVPIGWSFLNPGVEHPAPTPTALQPDIPRLLIEPFEDLTGTESSAIIARGLTEEIIGQIAKFRDLQIIEIPVASAKAIADGDLQISARYALLGSVRIADNTLRLTARLRQVEDGSILWAQSYDQDLGVQGLLAVQADIASDVTTALAQPYGVIFHADSARATQSPPDDWDAYTCTLSYYTYRHTLDWDVHARVQGCLEQTVEGHPAYATAWALLAMIYIDDYRFRFPKTAPPPLDRAIEAAKRASELDPRNARAQQALMMALFFNQEVTAAIKVGAEAVEFHPNDTELLAEYGVRLGQSGDWEGGRFFITEALTRNPIPPTYYEADLAVNFYMVRDYATAEIWIEKTKFEDNPLYHLIAAMIYGQLGRVQEGARERDWLLSNAPDLVKNIRTELLKRLARPEDQAHVIEGLILAGLPIPEA